MKATVITASRRAAEGVYEDTGGPLIVEALVEQGFEVTGPVVVPDGQPVADAIAAALADGARAILTTGGTGLTPTDLTPEMTMPFLHREVPGVAEAIRAYGAGRGVPTAALSRGLAGVSGSTLIVNLPGSPKAARESLEAVLAILPHAVALVRASAPRPSRKS